MKSPRTFPLFLAVAGAAAASGCGLNQEGVPPPVDTFFYPASAVTDPTGHWLFVANSNADLRYNDGTLVMVDLRSAASDYLRGRRDPNDPSSMGWDDCPEADYVNKPRVRSPEPQFCCWDQKDSNILNCDERFYIRPDSKVPTTTVAIGSFAAGMVLQDPKAAQQACESNDTGPRRLFVAVRGDTSITWVDLDDPKGDGSILRFKCNSSADGSQGLVTCDNDHRVTEGAVMLASATKDPNPPLVPLPNEPYALAIDDYYGLLYVGHLNGDTGHAYTGGFSLFDIAPEKDFLPPPEFIAPFPSPFPPNANGLFGVTAFSRRPQGASAPIVYASSRYTPIVTPLAAAVTCSESQASGQRFRDIAAFPSGFSYSTNIAGSETRGIEFVGDRPFVLQRFPPALVTFSSTPTGMMPASMVETCSNPTYLYQYAPAGQNPRLLVNCYDVGEIDVFDTVAPHLIRGFSVGRGPAGLVFPPSSAFPGRSVAYVVGFGDNNISVVDLTPGSPTELHVIQRIGFPSTVPR